MNVFCFVLRINKKRVDVSFCSFKMADNYEYLLSYK